MKKLIVLLGLCLIGGLSLNAQDCYSKYTRAFKERGAEEVVDSTYEDVIITVRNGNGAECLLGKVIVKKGKVLLHNFYLKLEDDSYENVGPRFKPNQSIEIKNGISQIIVAKDDLLYNVVFIGHLKAKKKGYMKAPDYDLD